MPYMRPRLRNAMHRHPTLADTAAQSIEQLILAGDFPPGMRLKIDELAARLDMSPMPIREALQHLDAMGFVEHVPRRGSRVREISIDELHDIYEARLSLETLAIRHAALSFDRSHELKATKLLADYVTALTAGEAAIARQNHCDFHFALYEASGKDWLVRLICPLFQAAERYRVASLPERGSVDELRQEHLRILTSCVQHNPEDASRALHDHLTRTANVLANSMSQGDII